ncbi:MAG: 3,4-dihydroxy-2-butanone-4-phosphate synthase [Alcaligenaceae bacterium]|nr:3,4-dihydroxy-2-butanone-4-phosphate synthase [Alcaligenaceae bacterium SAGV5]MPS55454.1 3,4-dihydroxy-2-butanone-4-phosphate synthase [Alcaligenaceae bacterium SAGV3]MPT60145.1 3,4-dihydroxy-2-butanone-4-phosphate synthase [Alcaligenaceae bacterium]
MQSLQQYFEATTAEQRLLAALAALKLGQPAVLLDDEDRENEADLIIAAESITEPIMARMIRDCSGIVCLCLTPDSVEALGLPQMTSRNHSRNGTAFTVSIEARDGVSTGVSAADRITTVRAALTGDPAALVSPGHMFPLRADPRGVLGRRGHTEGSVDLAALAGLAPAALLCELMHEDGSMMRGDAALAYAREHGWPLLTIEDIVAWRSRADLPAEEAIAA